MGLECGQEARFFLPVVIDVSDTLVQSGPEKQPE